jgi:hypothetical protein
MIPTMVSADMMPSTLRNEPIEKIEPNDPIDPMENAEPRDPIERTEFFDQRLSTEFSDLYDITDRLFMMGALLDAGSGQSLQAQEARQALLRRRQMTIRPRHFPVFGSADSLDGSRPAP